MKQPYAFSLADGSPLAFAELWKAWKDPANEQWLQTFAFITTEPNELTAEVHDRMPMVLHPNDYVLCLFRGELEQLPVDLLRPYKAADGPAPE
jgi:putative SOS response-associated peptidase YedK